MFTDGIERNACLILDMPSRFTSLPGGFCAFSCAPASRIRMGRDASKSILEAFRQRKNRSESPEGQTLGERIGEHFLTENSSAGFANNSRVADEPGRFE